MCETSMESENKTFMCPVKRSYVPKRGPTEKVWEPLDDQDNAIWSVLFFFNSGKTMGRKKKKGISPSVLCHFKKG